MNDAYWHTVLHFCEADCPCRSWFSLDKWTTWGPHSIGRDTINDQTFEIAEQRGRFKVGKYNYELVNVGIAKIVDNVHTWNYQLDGPTRGALLTVLDRSLRAHHDLDAIVFIKEKDHPVNDVFDRQVSCNRKGGSRVTNSVSLYDLRLDSDRTVTGHITRELSREPTLEPMLERLAKFNKVTNAR